MIPQQPKSMSMLILLIESCAPLTEINHPSRPERMRRRRVRTIELTAGSEEGRRLSRMLARMTPEMQRMRGWGLTMI